MQSRATKQTPAPNAAEKRFQAYTKESDCICCGNLGPSIADHIWGKSKKLYIDNIQRVHVGHWAMIPLCEYCDPVKTQGSRREFFEDFGCQVGMWREHSASYAYSGGEVPTLVINAMKGATWAS